MKIKTYVCRRCEILVKIAAVQILHDERGFVLVKKIAKTRDNKLILALKVEFDWKAAACRKYSSAQFASFTFLNDRLALAAQQFYGDKLVSLASTSFVLIQVNFGEEA